MKTYFHEYKIFTQLGIQKVSVESEGIEANIKRDYNLICEFLFKNYQILELEIVHIEHFGSTTKPEPSKAPKPREGLQGNQRPNKKAAKG